ncbi:MAG TPA: SprB repeat-containing protein, partial [Bacteroidia bacterium]|nr:SprB repeat-containing protein [Bacteroidia bacterium]
MKKILLASVLIFSGFFSGRLHAQMTTFRFSYDVGLFDISGGMVQNPAGDFVIAGLNNSFGPYYGNAIKVDAQGNVVWAKAYTGGFATSFNDIKNVSTGGYIMTGQSTSGGGGALLVRIDANGNVLWAYRYQLPDIPSGNASNEYGNAVIETSDGGFLVGGGVDYFWDGVSANTVDTTSAMGFKVNSSGTLQWSKVWTIATANPDEHYINDVAESADGYFFVGQSSEGSGTLSSNGDYPSNALIIKTTTAGALTYIRRWGAGNTSSQGINCAITLSTGNILLGGFDDVNAFIVSISGTGSSTPTVIFNKRLNGSIFGNTFLLEDIMENSDGNYSMIGTQLAFLSVSLNTMIGKINSSTGAWMFGRTYAPIGLSAILPEGGLCSDQGYFVSMTDQQAAGFNYNVIRTNTSGQTNDPASGCPGTSITPTLGSESVTFSTPTSSNYDLMTSSTWTPVVQNLTPTRTQHCYNAPTPLSTTSTSTNVTCFGGCNGTATANPSGGTAPYTYSWNSTPVQTTQTATGLCPGSYTCTVTDNASATTTVTVNITQPVSALSASIPSPTNVTCNGSCNGSATVNASGGTSGYTYSWNSAPVQTTATASNLCAGSYTVTVTDANSCTTTQSVTITQPSAITASATSTPSSCSSNTGTATVSAGGGAGGYTYSWAPSGGTGATANNLAPGNYTVTVHDANNCTQTATVNVTTTTGPSASLQSQSNVSCNGGTNGSATVNASGGSPGYSYSWTSGGSSATENNLPAGNYTCTITDAAGCVTTQSVAITEPSVLSPSSTTSPTGCTSSGSATETPSGGTSPYTYAWSSGGTAATESNLGVGTYT